MRREFLIWDLRRFFAIDSESKLSCFSRILTRSRKLWHNNFGPEKKGEDKGEGRKSISTSNKRNWHTERGRADNEDLQWLEIIAYRKKGLLCGLCRKSPPKFLKSLPNESELAKRNSMRF